MRIAGLAKEGLLSCGVALMFVWSAVLPAWGAEEEFAQVVKPELVVSASQVTAGAELRVGVLFEIQKPWHIYWYNPGDSGLPTTVQWKITPAVEVPPNRYPIPIRFVQPGDIVGYGYEDRVLLGTTVELPSDLAAGTKIDIVAQVRWLACAHVCVPGSAELKGGVAVGSSTAAAQIDLFRVWDERMPMALTDAEGVINEGVPLSLQTSREAAPGGEKVTIALDWDEPPQGFEWFFGGYKVASAEGTEVKTAGKSSTISFTLRSQAKNPTTIESLVLFDVPDGPKKAVIVPLALTP